MSSLYLIRHGQASFGARDYDVLSPLGVEQSRCLGAHIAAKGPHLDALYTGPRKRQIDTARHLVAAARAAGSDLPDATVVDELDEYPAFDILGHWGPILATEDPELRAALEMQPQPDLDRAFNLIIGRWVAGELEAPHIESYRGFVARVEKGLLQLMEWVARGRRAAIVTSGGPISIALKLALGLSDEVTMRMALVVANTSVSEFRFREPELTMFSFNEISHLEEESLITYR